jgi:hypothetical protein
MATEFHRQKQNPPKNTTYQTGKNTHTKHTPKWTNFLKCSKMDPILPNALKWIKFSKMHQMLHPNGIKCSQMKFHPTLILQYLAEFIYHNNIYLWKLTLDTLHSYLCTYLSTYLPTSLDDVSLISDIEKLYILEVYTSIYWLGSASVCNKGRETIMGQ